METLKITDVFRVDYGTDKNVSFMFYQASIIFRTSNNSYKVENVKQIDEKFELIKSMIKKDEE